MYNSTIKLVYWQLLLYGVHVGHSFSNSIIFSAWLVYTYRQNILIINLFKTVLMFKNGYVGLSGACHFSGPIWFINLHRSVELFVNYSAKQCGEFCYTTYWIHGLISNWLTLANTFKKLNRMVLTSNKGQFKKLELESSPLVMGRFSWPRATFVSSVSTSPHPTKESLYLGIPCLGIVDTDISGHIANIAIPGNDDALDCVVFYNTHISQYILEKKYGNISGWFYHIRKHKRIITFLDWILNNYVTEKGYINKNEILYEQKKKDSLLNNLKSNLKFKVPYSTIWTYGLDFFFSKNYGLDSFKEQVDLYEEDDYLMLDLDYYLTKHRKSSVYLTKVINYYILKASWRFNRFIKRNVFKNKLFIRRFLVGFYEKTSFWDITNSKNYMKSRFYVNRFYKTHLRRNKWRFNKFILKFVKFYFITKFMNCRGFITTYNSNIMKVSSLAFVSFSLGSRLFVKGLYNKLLTNSFSKDYQKGKKNLLLKWYFFKKNVIKKLVTILNQKNITKFYKISLKWKINKILTFLLQKNIKFFYMYYMSFFNFFLWNRTVLLRNKTEYNRYCLKEWKILKGIQRNYLYINFLKQANDSYLKFQNTFNFNNKYINKSKSLIFFFNKLTSDYRKTFFLNVTNYKFDLLLRFPKYFKKIFKKNVRKRNWIYRKLTRRVKAALFIKNSKFYKGKRKYRKIIYYKRRVLKSKRDLVYLSNKLNLNYKKNKYLVDFSPKNLNRFLTLNNYLNNLSKINTKINKVKYFFSNILNFNELQFVNISYNSYNKYISTRFIEKSLKKESLNFSFNDSFFNDFSISSFRLNKLVYRYYYPYFFRWEYLKNEDNNITRNLLLLQKNNKSDNILKKNIKKIFHYIELRIKAYNVYKKHKIAIKGISNYILTGDHKMKTIFINRFWIYSKSIFFYPSFFYLNEKRNRFNILSTSLFKIHILKWNKSRNIKKYFYLFHFIRIFSIYHKYFFSFYNNNSISSKLLFLKYDINKKRIFWN